MSEIPFISQGAELISAGISFGTGDIVGGVIGLGSMVPLVGKVAEGAKLARAANNVVHALRGFESQKYIFNNTEILLEKEHGRIEYRQASFYEVESICFEKNRVAGRWDRCAFATLASIISVAGNLLREQKNDFPKAMQEDLVCDPTLAVSLFKHHDLL